MNTHRRLVECGLQIVVVALLWLAVVGAGLFVAQFGGPDYNAHVEAGPGR